MQNIKQKLETIFRRIEEERMRDVPICNPNLEVAAIGFKQGENENLGILLTPWCMNLMLLPGSEDWSQLKLGDKQRHTLPSGKYEFVVAEEVDLGRYQSCSLFSPMFQFGDQKTALATAEAALVAVLDGTDSQPHTKSSTQNAAIASSGLSRRDFLRGGRAK
jgi:[NiFe] hydrogenase assembly HybE family chaperone